MTVLINFLGSPGVGKTSLCAKLFASMKARDMNVEFVQEHIKSWVYENKAVNKYSQYTIFGIEVENQSRLFNKVDFVISDAPITLVCFYNFYYNKGDKSLNEACREFYRKTSEDNVKVVNFFLQRQKDYDQRGRYQTQEESDRLSKILQAWLNFEGYNYYDLKCSDEERLTKVIECLKNEGVL